MQVYKVFFRILNKQKGQIIMYLGIFLGIATIMSNQAQNTNNNSFEKTSYSFAVFDEDGSDASRSMTEYLSKGNERVELQDDKETIQDELYNRNISCVIRIPKGFGESLTGGGDVVKPEITTVPGTIYGETFKNMVSRYSSIAKGYQAGGFSESEIIGKTGSACQDSVTVKMAEGAKSSEHGSLYWSFAYLPYIFISICVVGIGPILVVFHKKEVAERNHCSSYPQSRTNLELYAGVVTTGIGLCICYCLMVILAMKNGMKFFCLQGFLYCLNMLCFMVVALGIVFLLGQVVKKTVALNMISNVIALGMSFLCGVFVPLEYLGEGLIKAAHFLPAYWYITSANFIDTYVPGSSLNELWVGLGIQLLFGAALISIGLAYSRIKLSAGEN